MTSQVVRDTHKIVHLPTGKTVMTGTHAECMSAADQWMRVTGKRIHEVRPNEPQEAKADSQAARTSR